VRVPQLRAVEAVEGAAHQFAALHRQQKTGAAGIDEALFRPEFPGGK